jgi:hypothetical protein
MASQDTQDSFFLPSIIIVRQNSQHFFLLSYNIPPQHFVSSDQINVLSYGIFHNGQHFQSFNMVHPTQLAASRATSTKDFT